MSTNATPITHIGQCDLTWVGQDQDDPPGYWREATCAEWSEAVKAHGGLGNLSVWSAFTNLELSDLGEPFIFTMWGEKSSDGLPVVADGGHPDQRVVSGSRRCGMQHAVFVPNELFPQ